jgi:hypothetical protein
MLSNNKISRSLAITTHIGCKNQCAYCPQHTIIKSYSAHSSKSKMHLDDFKKYIASVPRSIPLSFAGFSEPWLNPETTAMLLYANEKGFPIRVNTTLVGMQKEDIMQMGKVPFIKFAVHLPDNAAHTKIKVDENYLEVLETLISSKLQKQFFKYHKEKNTDLATEIKELLQMHNKKAHSFGLNNRAGYSKTEYNYFLPNKAKKLKACSDFRHNILLPNGDVVLCHMDWAMQHVLGNLGEISYNELYTSDEFEIIQQALSNPKSALLCRQCEKDIVKRSSFAQVLKNMDNLLKGRKLY